MKNSMTLFAERLGQFLKQLGWSQEELGHRSGVTTSSINMYLQGKREPSLVVIDRIARAIGVPPRVFFEDADFPILKFMPTAKDAIKIIEKAIDDMAFFESWKRSELELLAKIKEDDDRATVLSCAADILRIRHPEQKKGAPLSLRKKS